jgi:hypothetical protein
MRGIYLRNQLRHKPVNKELAEDCQDHSGIEGLDEDEAATVILSELWKNLREKYKLNVK